MKKFLWAVLLLLPVVWCAGVEPAGADRDGQPAGTLERIVFLVR